MLRKCYQYYNLKIIERAEKLIEPKSKQEFSKDRKAFVKRHQIKSEV